MVVALIQKFVIYHKIEKGDRFKWVFEIYYIYFYNRHVFSRGFLVLSCNLQIYIVTEVGKIIIC